MTRTRLAWAMTMCAALAAAATVSADVRIEERALVKFEGMMGRVVGIFGGKAAREGVKTTTAVKGDRKISMTDTTGQIVDLAEEKVYELDVRRKTYKVTTFADMRRRMEEARKRAEEDARRQQGQGDAKAEKEPEAAKDPNAKEFEVDFNLKETGEK